MQAHESSKLRGKKRKELYQTNVFNALEMNRQIDGLPFHCMDDSTICGTPNKRE
jgi:hypothetical protein